MKAEVVVLLRGVKSGQRQLKMLSQIGHTNVPGRDDGELHWKHGITCCHPGARNDLVPKGDDVLHGLSIHQMRSAFYFDDGLVRADCVMAMLKIKAQGEMGGVFEEDLTNWTANNIVDGQKLYRRLAVSTVT